MVGSLLTAHGFQGNQASSSILRVDKLRKALRELETSGAPSAGTSKSMFTDAEPWAFDEEVAAWTDRLPADLKRSAPENYCNVVSCGSMRDFVNSSFPMDRREGYGSFLELVNLAASVDFLVTECKMASEVAQVRASSNLSEIALTRLAVAIHDRRTGDKVAATIGSGGGGHLLAVRAHA